jgi:hypothetical protein
MSDPLPSWNDGPAKRRIVAAVRSMAEREYAYHAGAEEALETAGAAGWVVVSMRHDFASVFDLAD